MTDRSHVLSTKWREADLNALEERVRAMDEWLEHTEDLVAMFESNATVITELLSMSGLVRTLKNDISQEADKLNAILIDRS